MLPRFLRSVADVRYEEKSGKSRSCRLKSPVRGLGRRKGLGEELFGVVCAGAEACLRQAGPGLLRSGEERTPEEKRNPRAQPGVAVPQGGVALGA